MVQAQEKELNNQPLTDNVGGFFYSLAPQFAPQKVVFMDGSSFFSVACFSF